MHDVDLFSETPSTAAIRWKLSMLSCSSYYR